MPGESVLLLHFCLATFQDISPVMMYSFWQHSVMEGVVL